MTVLIIMAARAMLPEIDLLPRIAWHKNANNGSNITRMLAITGDMERKSFTLVLQFVDVFGINGFKISIYIQNDR